MLWVAHDAADFEKRLEMTRETEMKKFLVKEARVIEYVVEAPDDATQEELKAMGFRQRAKASATGKNSSLRDRRLSPHH